MAHERARNIQDALVNPVVTTMPSGVGSVTSGVIDLGAESTFRPENFEVELSVPALSTTINPGTSTAGVTVIIESSTTSTFAAVDATYYSKNYAGSTTTATAAVSPRVRPPSDCARYIRGKVTFGTTTGDASALFATFSARF